MAPQVFPAEFLPCCFRFGYNDVRMIVYWGDYMCDVKKYEAIFEEIMRLQPEDTMQLVLEAATEEQKDFYEMIGDFLLQNKQRQVIAGNLF